MSVLEFLPQISKWYPVAQANVLGINLDSSLSHTSHHQTYHQVQSALSKVNWDSFTSMYTANPVVAIIFHLNYFNHPAFYKLCIRKSDDVIPQAMSHHYSRNKIQTIYHNLHSLT